SGGPPPGVVVARGRLAGAAEFLGRGIKRGSRRGYGGWPRGVEGRVVDGLERGVRALSAPGLDRALVSTGPHRGNGQRRIARNVEVHDEIGLGAHDLLPL